VIRQVFPATGECRQHCYEGGGVDEERCLPRQPCLGRILARNHMAYIESRRHLPWHHIHWRGLPNGEQGASVPCPAFEGCAGLVGRDGLKCEAHDVQMMRSCRVSKLLQEMECPSLHERRGLRGTELLPLRVGLCDHDNRSQGSSFPNAAPPCRSFHRPILITNE
jgi:hypothetical protein